MMTKFVRVAWVLCESSCLRRLEVLHNGVSRAQIISASAGSFRSCEPFYNWCLSNPVCSRALSANAVHTNTREERKASPLSEYKSRIASGELLDGDNGQIDTVRLLDTLYNELLEFEDTCKLDRYSSSGKPSRSWWLWCRLIPQSSHAPLKGLYLHGGVGTGKTMLMDLFYDQLPSYWRKKRVHFHDFMLNVHSRLQRHKGLEDPLYFVAGEIADDSILLCLDEFMVNDVADALILNRLFGCLFSKGVVLVATSNRAPDDLYQGGLQRDLFMRFVETLKERCIVHPIGSSTDYRKMTSAEQGFYFVGNEYSDVLKKKFYFLAGKQASGPQTVEVVMGRQLQIPIGSNGCAYFQFEYLCNRPLGAADYSGLFKKFHTLALEGVPKFGPHNRPAAYRFVILIDVMYDRKARLLCTAEASPIELFDRVMTVADAQKLSSRNSSRAQQIDIIDICADDKLGFSKDRTISRLTEMNSSEYLKRHETILQAGHWDGQQCDALRT